MVWPFEPSPIFKAGLPDEYPVGTVSERWGQEQRVWIIHEPDGFYALLAICTHLGCTPNRLNAENKFKCPCHGSGFRRTGVNFEGPAPRPLDRVKVAVADDEQFLIDKSVQFRYERGDWTKPGAYLKLKVQCRSNLIGQMTRLCDTSRARRSPRAPSTVGPRT